jgi:hypothetical protein
VNLEDILSQLKLSSFNDINKPVQPGGNVKAKPDPSQDDLNRLLMYAVGNDPRPISFSSDNVQRLLSPSESKARTDMSVDGLLQRLRKASENVGAQGNEVKYNLDDWQTILRNVAVLTS